MNQESRKVQHPKCCSPASHYLFSQREGFLIFSNTHARAVGVLNAYYCVTLGFVLQRLPVRILDRLNLFPQGRTGFGANRILDTVLITIFNDTGLMPILFDGVVVLVTIACPPPCYMSNHGHIGRRIRFIGHNLGGVDIQCDLFAAVQGTGLTSPRLLFAAANALPIPSSP